MNKERGFSLIELIISITLLAVVMVVVSVIIKTPFIGYEQTSKRAELVDAADTSLRKIKREIQKSLPNSIRVQNNGGKTYIELLLIKDVGVYRIEKDNLGNGDVLDFTTTDTSFDNLSGTISFDGNEEIVIYNLGVTGYDAYNGDNRSTYTGGIGSNSVIQINPKQFPLESPSGKFFVISTPVTYVCDPVNHTITRYTSYTIQNSQPNDVNAAPLSTANKGILTNKVQSCTFNYTDGLNSRNAIVSVLITLENDGEKVTLYGDTYVPNSQ